MTPRYVRRERRACVRAALESWLLAERDLIPNRADTAASLAVRQKNPGAEVHDVGARRKIVDRLARRKNDRRRPEPLPGHRRWKREADRARRSAHIVADGAKIWMRRRENNRERIGDLLTAVADQLL